MVTRRLQVLSTVTPKRIIADVAGITGVGKFVWVTISTKMLTQKQMIDFFTVFPEWLRGFKSPNWVTIEMSAFGLRDENHRDVMQPTFDRIESVVGVSPPPSIGEVLTNGWNFPTAVGWTWEVVGGDLMNWSKVSEDWEDVMEIVAQK